MSDIIEERGYPPYTNQASSASSNDFSSDDEMYQPERARNLRDAREKMEDARAAYRRAKTALRLSKELLRAAKSKYDEIMQDYANATFETDGSADFEVSPL